MIEKFRQVDNINYLINKFGKELWIQVYGDREINDADVLFWAGLIPNNDISTVLSTCEWEHEIGCELPGFVQSGNEGSVYKRYGGCKYEPLIFSRDYHGLFKSNIEINEEFRLLNNLYFDIEKNKYFEITENGDLDPIIKVEDENVFIKLSHLKKFAAVKQMAIALYFDIQFDSTMTHEDMEIKPIIDSYSGKYYCFDVISQDDNLISGKVKSSSVIYGKKLLFGVDIEKCGYWPYDKNVDFENFIIGIDGDGEEVAFGSNPNNLANFFGANPESPHFSTSVYFSKDVLNKYYSKPELYEVNDGHIKCQELWLLKIDNSNRDFVSVYLGDLGRNIPYKEQVYWKSFNIIPDGKISEVKFKRGFLAEFADPDIADLKFKQKLTTFRKKWYAKYGWNLFLELSQDDKYNFENLRIPISKSQVEFDGLVLSLVKTIIDSINEKKLNKLIDNKDNLKASISRLERYFEEENIKEYENQIKFLRNLQDLRSTGSSHRKGKGYIKASEVFALKNGNYFEVFEKILKQAISFIDFLEDRFLK